MHSAAPARLLILAGIATTVGAQTELFRFSGTPSDGFGAAVLGPGDLDLDGYPDILVAAPQGNAGAGVVHVYSGRNGVLRQSIADPGSAAFGTRLRAAGDIDRDGNPDFWVEDSAHLTAWSGRTLSRLHSTTTVPSWDAPGDANGDGVPDLLLKTTTVPADVIALSGRDMSVIFRRANTGTDTFLFIKWVGDINHDGRSDILAGGGDGTSWIRLVSSADGSTIREHRVAGYQRPITDGGTLGDVDRDGTDDYYMYQPKRGIEGYQNAGVIDVFSGRTGSLIRTIEGYTVGDGRYAPRPTETIDRVLGFGSFAANGLSCVLTRHSHPLGRPFVSVRLVEGDEVFATPGNNATPAGDVDRDGATDLLVSDQSVAAVAVIAVRPLTRLGRIEPSSGVSYSLGPPWASMSRLGDMNGDGIPDVAALWPLWTYPSGFSSVCKVMSGLDFAPILSVGLLASTNSPDGSAADAGDIDGDGRSDLVLGWSRYYGPSRGQGGVYGSSGLIFALNHIDRSYGSSVCGNIDWNSDGRSDIIVSADTFAEVLSGRDQTVLYRWSRGGKLITLGDIDRDGTRDVALGETVYASRSGVALGTRVGCFAWADARDADGDSVPDLWSATAGGIELVSGRAWATIRTIAWPFANPSPTLASEDWDADGVMDLAVGSSSDNVAVVLSGRDGRSLFRYGGRAPNDGLGESVALVSGVLPARPRLVAAAALGGSLNIGYALLAAQPRFPPGASDFGQPCGPRLGEPALHWIGGYPSVGSTRSARIAGSIPGVVSLWAGTETDWAGAILPLNLGLIGLPACVLHTSPVFIAMTAMAPPTTDIPIAIPLDVNWLGQSLALQAATVSVAPSAIAFTNAVRIRISQ